jgi:L-asparaginase
MVSCIGAWHGLPRYRSGIRIANPAFARSMCHWLAGMTASIRVFMHQRDLHGVRDLPRVDIVYSYAGVDGFVVEKLVEAGAKGIVIAGMPSGTAPPAQNAALVKASHDGVLVVKSRRSNAGRQYIHAKDVDTGIISADNLNPQKARVLTMIALAQTGDRNEIRRMFLEY